MTFQYCSQKDKNVEKCNKNENDDKFQNLLKIEKSVKLMKNEKMMEIENPNELIKIIQKIIFIDFYSK